MPHGSVQYHLNTIISNEQPFLGCYSFKKNEIWGHFGPKWGIYWPHTCSIIALLPLHELCMSHGSVQYHLNTIISNGRSFLGCYSFKKMKFGVILGQKEGFIDPTRVLY